MKEFFQHAPTANACHVYGMLKKASKRRHLSFHTPGHKRPNWDITELSFSDCLADPQGVILQAQRDVEGIVKSKASEFLTDGSTSGVYTLLYLLKSKGVEKVAVSPFSHISVFRGLALLGLQPVMIEGQTPFSQPTETQIATALAKADALFLTSPNYYGKTADLSSARRLVDKQNKYFVVDQAHGAHLHHKPWQYAGNYADGWVDGAHKSLPCMTQGALVSVAREDWVDGLRAIAPLFRTTSPSYPILASIEYAYKYPRNTALEGLAATFIRENPHRLLPAEDWTKICAYFGSQCESVQKALEKKGIYAEFCDGAFLTFYLSPATKIGEFNRLKKMLSWAFSLYPVKEGEMEDAIAAPATITPISGKTEWILIENAVGRVASSSFGIFPPCLPLATDGRRIDEQIVARMQGAAHTFGVERGRIQVYEEGEKR